MGRENGNIGRAPPERWSPVCAMQKIRFDRRQLVSVARFLCCVHHDAAMHNRKPRIGFDFRIEQAQHQSDAIDARLRRRFE
jgi:hypothetical protein